MAEFSKQELRELVLAARSQLTAEDRAGRSADIAARLVALDLFSRAQVVALYAPIGAEVDPGAIAAAALAAGKRIAFPRLSQAERVLAFALCDQEALVPGPFGTREPPASAPLLPLTAIDLALVPGVAFDPGCHRLGRGRGCYDATLAALPARASRVGIAFEVQIVPKVTCEAHDVRLDAVVTEARVLDPSSLGTQGRTH